MHATKASEIYFDTFNSNVKTAYDTSFTINDPLVSVGSNLAEVSVQEVIIPNVVYPVNRYYNTVYWTEFNVLAVNKQATLEYNNYTGPQFAAALQQQMSFASATSFTVTYDEQAKKLTFTIAVGTFLFRSGERDLNAEMGITDGQPELTTFSTMHTSSSPINISGSKYVTLSTNLQTPNVAVGRQLDPLAVIPLTLGFGQVISWSPQTEKPITLPGRNLTSLNLQLYDDRGNLWELPETHDIQFTLFIRYHKGEEADRSQPLQIETIY